MLLPTPVKISPKFKKKGLVDSGPVWSRSQGAWMCNCWCERWFPEPKCTCTLVGRCRCWLEFVAWWKTKLSPQVQICQRWLYSRIMILAMPTLEENIVLIQSSLFTLMIIVVCKLDYLMYIKYVNTGDSSLTAERSFFTCCAAGNRHFNLNATQKSMLSP